MPCCVSKGDGIDGEETVGDKVDVPGEMVPASDPLLFSCGGVGGECDDTSDLMKTIKKRRGQQGESKVSTRLTKIKSLVNHDNPPQ